MKDQPTGLAKMREAFLPNQISKLCRSTKKDNPKASCRVCGGYHGQPSIALDYVGHAALTDRLLDCDPLWAWEPMALDATGSPLLDRDGGMWIKLTVCGVTRLGYGDAQGKSGGDAMKERIGDALRNAAMRFGAALELWHKGELHVDDDETKAAKKTPPSKPQEPAKTADHQSSTADKDSEYHERIKAALKFIYGDDKAGALAHVVELTTWEKDGKTIQGNPDYRKKTGKGAHILAHQLEKIANEPRTCQFCDAVIGAGGKCTNANCSQPLEPPPGE